MNAQLVAPPPGIDHGRPGASAAGMSRALQRNADMPRRHTRRFVAHRTVDRMARRTLATFLGVGVGLATGGAPLLLAVCTGLLLAAAWPLHWLATLPPAPGEPDPTALRWSAGAAGERRTGRLLRPLRRRGWVVLHDRQIPGTQANIDHLVIGPNGVQLIDSKAWQAPVQVWQDYLWCGRHPVDLRTTAWEALRVEETLGLSLMLSGCIQVEAIVCVHGPAIPRPGFSFSISRAELGSQRPGAVVVHVIAARDLRRHIERSGAGMVLAGDVAELARSAAQQLPVVA